MGILGFILFLFIPIIFGGVGVGVYLGMIKPQIEAGNILKNGTETTATIVDVNSNVTASSSSGNTTKKVRYYFISLTFTNSKGNEINYKTRSVYPQEFIRKYHIEKGETVQVMYLDTKAVVKGFSPGYETWLWLFPVIFGAIAAGFLLLFIFSLVSTANNYIIKKFGTPVTGKYLEQKKLIKNHELDLNSITCIIENNNGETITVKTSFIYTYSDAEKLAKMESFPMVYKGKKAIIMIDKI